jgi:outer membrane protein OmpA-like peptidoglycan-associated protein
MWRSTIVALALVCLVLLGWYGATRYPGRIEADIQARAQRAVEGRAGLIVKASERTLVLQGTVKSEQERLEIERLAADLPGVKEVNSALTVAPPAPEAPPSSGPKALLDLEIVWSGKTIELRGSLPKALQRDFDAHLLASFGTTGIEVVRRIGQPEGEPPKEGQAQLEDAINALVEMSSGRARIVGGALAISGVVPSSEVEGRVISIAAKAKAQVSLTVRPPGAEIADVVDAKVLDTAPAADTLPLDVALADAGPTDVGIADAGQADAATTETTAPETKVAPSTAPTGTGPLTLEACRDAVKATIDAEKRITFDTGTARFTPDGLAKVDAVWALLQRCPNAKGVIEGYHDDLGDPDKIKTLTIMRAAAVYKRFTELGMGKGRFRYYGLGYRNMRFGGRPDRRALNQRVEIKLLSE